MSHMNHQRHMVLLMCEETPAWFRRAFQLAVHATSFTPADKVAEGLWQEIREGFDAGDQALAEHYLPSNREPIFVRSEPDCPAELSKT